MSSTFQLIVYAAERPGVSGGQLCHQRLWIWCLIGKNVREGPARGMFELMVDAVYGSGYQVGSCDVQIYRYCVSLRS